jgi:hypothetical protein
MYHWLSKEWLMQVKLTILVEISEKNRYNN